MIIGQLYFLSLPFFLYLFYFLFSIFISWFVPGQVLLQKLRLNKLQGIVLSLVTGIALWGWQGFLFGYLNIRWGSYVYLLVFLFLFIKNKLYLQWRKLSTIHFDWLLIAILFLGVVFQLSGVFLMGARLPQGIVQCCGQVPDNNLDLSLVSEIVQRFPPNEPGMFGQLLQNYHYWNHLVLAELIRVFNLPLIATVYQYSTIIFSLLYGLLFIAIAQMLKMKRLFVRLLLVFAYFGGDAGYIIPFVQGKLGFPNIGLENGAQLFMNYPRAVATIVFLGGLGLFLQWIKDKKLSTGIFMGLVWGCVIGFKVYTGFFILAGCFAYGIYMLLKRQYRLTLPLFLIGLLSLIIYIPVNGHAGGLFFSGFWRVNDFIVNPSLNLSHLELAREIYAQHNNIIRVIMYEALFFFVYLLVIFGTKLIGVFQTKQSLALFPKELHIFFIPAFACSFIAGMFFLQATGGANTFNFLVTILILGCFYSALAVDALYKKLPRIFSRYILIILIGLTIPRVFLYVYSMPLFQGTAHISFISPKELEAMSYLKDKTPKNSIYITELNDFEFSAPTIPYLTQRNAFLAGSLYELKDHGIDDRQRKVEDKIIFSSTNSAQVTNILHKENIRYIYMPQGDILPVATTSAMLKVVFNNEVRKIYQVY